MPYCFQDEISTGLDSATTYQIVRCIRNFVHLQDATVLVSLLQPAPEAFEQFDDVILLSEGSLVYHGPRGRILEFFEMLGFRCPERKGIADFLQEVTSLKDQRVRPEPFGSTRSGDVALNLCFHHFGVLGSGFCRCGLSNIVCWESVKARRLERVYVRRLL